MIIGENQNKFATTLLRPVYRIINSAYNKIKKQYVNTEILLKNIFFFGLISKIQATKDITGIYKGKRSLLFKVGKISSLKLFLQFKLFRNLIFKQLNN